MSKLENIEHSTFNAEHSMNHRHSPLSALEVECWRLNVFFFLTGGRS